MKLLSFLIFAGVIALSFARANKATVGGKFANNFNKYEIYCNKHLKNAIRSNHYF